MRRLALLAPGTFLSAESYEQTLAVHRTGDPSLCVYNYMTVDQAEAMMRLVGYA